MKFLKFALLVLLVSAGTLSAQVHDHKEGHNAELNERDVQALQQFVSTKRAIDLKEKVDHLEIAGDVRTEWRHMTERDKKSTIRGVGFTHVRDPITHGRIPRRPDKNDLPIGCNDFDIEANLYFNYILEKAWAKMQIEFDNSAGIDNSIFCACDKHKNRFLGSGNCDDICLERAYMGYNVFKDCGRLDIELGRRHLYDVFDSEMQFLSRYDGILINYSDDLGFAEWYVHAIGFLIDQRVSHFGWGFETAFLNIQDSGIDLSYSFIDWRKRGLDHCGFHNPDNFKFANSQWTITYNFNKETFCRPAELYAAFIYNHKRPTRQNMAAYVGFYLGEVEKEGDWSFEVRYEWAQKYAIAYDDQSGIGVGNVLDDLCNYRYLGIAYQGVRFDTLYALTDNLTIQATLDIAGGPRMHRYSKMEIEAVYAF